MASPHEVTRLLREWANGGQAAALDALTPLVYSELRRLAGGYLRGEQPGHTLQPTALVHEAFLRLAAGALDCESRSHFFGIAAHLMRQILTDHARTRHAAKRGGHHERISLEGDLVVSPEREASLVALDEALEQLAALDPRKAQVVEMRFFGGLSVEESAEALKVSEVTVRRDWQFAKTWLLRELSRNQGDAV